MTGDDISRQQSMRRLTKHPSALQIPFMSPAGVDVPPSQTMAKALADAEVQSSLGPSMGVAPEETVCSLFSKLLAIFTRAVVGCRSTHWVTK